MAAGPAPQAPNVTTPKLPYIVTDGTLWPISHALLHPTYQSFNRSAFGSPCGICPTDLIQGAANKYRASFRRSRVQGRSWVDAVPVTSISRALNECALAGLSPDLFRQAAKQALSRGLVTRAELKEVEAALKPFGGIKG